MEKMINFEQQKLVVELEGIEGRGVTIFLNGTISHPKDIAQEVGAVRENCTYMRDYVLDEGGALLELRFDKVVY